MAPLEPPGNLFFVAKGVLKWVLFVWTLVYLKGRFVTPEKRVRRGLLNFLGLRGDLSFVRLRPPPPGPFPTDLKKWTVKGPLSTGDFYHYPNDYGQKRVPKKTIC